MKRRSLVVAAAAAVMLTFSGCAFEEMLGQLDSALESVSQADSSTADSSGTDEKPDDHSADKHKYEFQPSSKSDNTESAAEEESSSAAEPLGEIDEARFAANAKVVINSYFGLMGAAQYTDAFKLCTKDFLDKHYPHGLTDGENASPVTVSFYEDTEEFDTDETGRSRIRLTVSLAPQGNEDKAFDCYMYVAVSDEQFLISETEKVDSSAALVGELTQENIEQFARYVYDCTNIYIDMLEPGVYETGDGSELDRLIPEYTPGGHYMVTIGNEGVESVVYTVDNLTAVFPQ